MENAALILGPYKLEAGSNRNWSSGAEHSFIDEKQLTERYRRNTSAPPDVFDLIICVAPAEMVTRCDLFSIPPGIQSRHQSQVQRDSMAWLTQQQQADQRKSQSYTYSQNQNQSQLPPDTEQSVSTLSVCSLSSTLVPSKVQVQVAPSSSMTVEDANANSMGEYDLDNEKTLVTKLRKKPATPELPPPGGRDRDRDLDLNSSQLPTPNTQRSFSKCVPIQTSDVFLSHDYGKLAMVICEVSYVRMLIPKDPESIRTTSSVQNVDAIANQYNAMSPKSQSRGATGAGGASDHPKLFEVKCVMQRVQMSNGVFLTQDIYGMDRNCVEEPEPEPVTDDTPKAVGEGAPAAPPAQTPAGITLDSDAIECVICLTDPRIIAVYPCRHMCLCASCAEVLPSQVRQCRAVLCCAVLCRTTLVFNVLSSDAHQQLYLLRDHITQHHIIPYRTISHHIISHHTISHYIISYPITPHHTVSHHITSHAGQQVSYLPPSSQHAPQDQSQGNGR